MYVEFEVQHLDLEMKIPEIQLDEFDCRLGLAGWIVHREMKITSGDWGWLDGKYNVR